MLVLSSVSTTVMTFHYCNYPYAPPRHTVPPGSIAAIRE